MTKIWEHQQLSRAEIEKLKEEAKQAAQKMDEARRKLIDRKKRDADISKK